MDKETFERLKSLFCGLLAGAIMGGLIVGQTVSILHDNYWNDHWKSLAVKAGHAEWVANSKGEADFQWRYDCAKPALNTNHN